MLSPYPKFPQQCARESTPLRYTSCFIKVIAYSLLFPLTLSLVTACSEPTVDRDELVERGGVFYEKFSNEPYTGNTTGRTIGTVVAGKFEGEVLTYHENGQLESQQVVVRGVSQGAFRQFDEEGNLELAALLTNGVLDGEAKFYEGGELSWVGHYKEGVAHGPYEKLSGENHLLKGTFENGLRVGKWDLAFSADLVNNLEEMLSLEAEGRHTSTRFHSNGQVAESGMRENGVNVGTLYYFNEEGVLIRTAEFVNGKEITDE